MVYDAERQVSLLFGGGGNNDTWIWDGKNWRQANPASTPALRSGAAIGYDDARQLVVLFGGQTTDNRYGMLLNDTWLWNGSTWTQAAPATTPPARQGAGFTSYTAGQHLVLFGGSTGHTLLGDTWIWDGSNWQEHTSAEGPSPRVWAAMTYHTHTQQAILIGGAGEGSAAMPVALSDTWTWNGSGWQQLTSSTMPGVDYHCAVYDEARKVVAVYAATADKIDQGTGDSTSFHSETWVMS
jgi:Galactose oxidase, central domain